MTKQIFFISDVHLSHIQSARETNCRNKLISFLRSIHGAEALYILGDLFDFWFSYKHVIPKYHHKILSELSILRSSGTKILLMGGNHDYWLGDFFTDQLDIEILISETEIKIGEKRFYLAHGDALLPGDIGYKIMKKILRSRWAIFLFRWLHPDIGFKLAELISHTSRQYNSDGKSALDKIIKLGENFALEKFNEGTDFVLFGHFHRPHQFVNDDKRFLILGDWIEHFSYGKFDGENLNLCYFK